MWEPQSDKVGRDGKICSSTVSIFAVEAFYLFVKLTAKEFNLPNCVSVREELLVIQFVLTCRAFSEEVLGIYHKVWGKICK